MSAEDVDDSQCIAGTAKANLAFRISNAGRRSNVQLGLLVLCILRPFFHRLEKQDLEPIHSPEKCLNHKEC